MQGQRGMAGAGQGEYCGDRAEYDAQDSTNHHDLLVLMSRQHGRVPPPPQAVRRAFVTGACMACTLQARPFLRCRPIRSRRSEEHTSELQSLMSISYAVFCLQKKHMSHTNQQSDAMYKK